MLHTNHANFLKNLKVIDRSSSLSLSSYHNGEIVFNLEDQSIYIKTDEGFLKFGNSIDEANDELNEIIIQYSSLYINIYKKYSHDRDKI